MQNYFSSSLLVAAMLFTNVGCNQSASDKTISINDLRKEGVLIKDTSTSGHKVGEVTVQRHFGLVAMEDFFNENGKKDTVDMYTIHFFKVYQNNLRNYPMQLPANDDYDKASYKWLNDTTVFVTMMNSTTKQKGTVQVMQEGEGASAFPDTTFYIKGK